MTNNSPAFSVDVDGEAKDFFDTEADAEKFAEQFTNSTAKRITITNLGVLPGVVYTHKYWSQMDGKWVEVFPVT